MNGRRLLDNCTFHQMITYKIVLEADTFMEENPRYRNLSPEVYRFRKQDVF